MTAPHPHTLRSPRMNVLASCLLAVLAGFGTAHAEDGVATGKLVLEPGVAAFADQQGTASFGNAAIEAKWKLDGRHLVGMTVTDRVHNRTFEVPAPFALAMADGGTLKASDMNLLSAPKVVALPVDAQASRYSSRLPGKAVEASFADVDGRFRIDWRLVQRDGSPYLREEVSITALKQDEKIAKVSLLQSKVEAPEVVGTVNGSPIVDGDVYLGFENPLSDSTAYHREARLTLSRTLPLEKGKTVDYSAVVGVVRDGQLRRDFNSYVERERAHPYRTFLHYNSWYDIGYFTPYTEAEALDRINTFGEELAVKRGVKLDSFLFDDGWDDRSGAWNFSKDFPHGFVPLRDAAAKYGAAPGIWLSPWGGYGKPHDERIRNGKAAGYEIIDDGLALSGPKYYPRFHQVVMDMIDKQGINQFKFDGTGNVSSVFPGSRFDSDFAAAIQLISDIRKDKPNTFINLTTGTWASPFWLRYADTIWRDGEDDWYTGVGTMREQWITYRDQQTYQNIVLKGPLFPIDSLMLHGIIYAQKNPRLDTDPGHDFANEVRSYFATGTELQEMYITPSLLTPQDWDMLAEGAKWSRANAGVLRDNHWIGGDPGRLDVYGWAAWSPKKAIVTFRNPDDKPQIAVVDLQRQLQLPPGVARHFSVRDVWRNGGANVPKTLDADHASTITLAPFEVLTLELTPE
ncbi:enterotoxin [Rhodanobacter sp. DHB23]|uniref:enterotoxin n=1 Tax=Rhodanobacter sp. DHB23 TaxID=2775923 RepID=UPI00178227F9|nr:enterotoxin [Rhodanobacter sp. DHB23]MBD8872941.1 enterotoxin [Rhodanobacter sp. DHB23]